MIRILFSSFIVFLSLSTNWAAASKPEQKTNVELISFSSAKGVQIFDRSKARADFFVLANHFESQTNRIFCGPTTAAIVLNAMRIDDLRDESVKVVRDEKLLSKEDRKNLNPKRSYVYNRYTQNNVFDTSYLSNEKATKARAQVLGAKMPKTKKSDWGFQLSQLADLIEAHGLKAEARVVTDSLDSKVVKKEIIENLSRAGDFVVVNYARKALNQPGGGHISPLGAYDKASDSFLIMDVAPMKDDWVWVKSEDLISAMRTFDTVSNRGYVLISSEKTSE